MPSMCKAVYYQRTQSLKTTGAVQRSKKRQEADKPKGRWAPLSLRFAYVNVNFLNIRKKKIQFISFKLLSNTKNPFRKEVCMLVR